ncbi:replication initiation protein [Hymenobacter tibetensis]|uniref:Replication initiation protein n=1 Tax=Hymenobacter tibetensis TaxID=497967 RepID=A0ABY4D342_9BACT|nr:replication initiation protein [Hymenobacter tibetensis]UOG76762.1 replication initiation protein [Hymenobacter tibetensis]
MVTTSLALNKTMSREQVLARASVILATTKGNTLAYQHNLLVRHPLRLSSLEARLFVLALRCVHQSDAEFQGGFVVSLEELFPHGSSGERYEALEEAFKVLLGKHFKLERPDAGDGSYIYTQLISHIGLETGAGRVVGAFAPLVGPYLSQLQSGNFTKAKIETLLTFKNPTALKLYWYFRSWSNVRKVSIRVDELKTLLFEEEETYTTYADFKRYVLRPCLLEVQKFGEWNITYKEIKDGRKVVALEFHIPKIEDTEPTTPAIDTGTKTTALLPPTSLVEVTPATPQAQTGTGVLSIQDKVTNRLQKLLLKDNQIQDVVVFVGNDESMFMRFLKATNNLLRDYEAKNPGYVPTDKLAAATINALKNELGMWR